MVTLHSSILINCSFNSGLLQSCFCNHCAVLMSHVLLMDCSLLRIKWTVKLPKMAFNVVTFNVRMKGKKTQE